MGNRERAEQRANELDALIIQSLKNGDNFRVEAGAGAGKTYSLMKVIDWLEKEKHKQFNKNGQHVACITYTNAAVDVIKGRLKSENFIQPCTIHTFAWGLMKRFQSSLIKDVGELELLPKKDDGSPYTIDEVNRVSYELGTRYVRDGELFLYHDDVIKLFVNMLKKSKFRMILANQYPIILIDEYQDSFRSIMDLFLQYFIDQGEKPQFGLFGDSWQTIYSSMGACGEVVSEHITVINKEANFRSQDVIVQALNKIRPELPQMTATDETDGRIFVITTNDYVGLRQKGAHYKDELPDQELFSRVDSVREKLHDLGWDSKSQKTLMLTHRLLAKEQKYENLFSVLGDHLKDADDEHFLFFMNRVEPVYEALATNSPKNLFEALGIERKPIETIEKKQQWKLLRSSLETARQGRIIDVLDAVDGSGLIGIPDKISYWLSVYRANDHVSLFHKNPIETLYKIPYSEVLNAIEFQKPEAEFSTDHGVKGEEYESVLFVMGRGWANYRFDEYLIQNPQLLSGKELDAYIRNRNLFYVCCSRPMKNLAILVTFPVSGEFKAYLERVFGVNNLFDYPSFLQMTPD
ncbi:MAG: ATP-dependent helicase [Clostridia bacterium]|nr:ATP-dependent helicase [Clostridia bacterium]